MGSIFCLHKNEKPLINILNCAQPKKHKRPQNYDKQGKKSHITPLSDLKGKCMSSEIIPAGPVIKNLVAGLWQWQCLRAQIFHRPDTDATNFSLNTNQEQPPRTRWDLGSSQPSSNCSPSEKGHDKTTHPYLLLHLSSTNGSGKENPKQQTPPENSPHGGYTVDELFRLIWQPGWKNYFNWLQAQNAALQLRAWSTVPKTVKNHFSCSWLDRLPNKNTYPRRHWIFTFSGTASVAQTVQRQRKSVVYGTKLHSTSTHSEADHQKTWMCFLSNPWHNNNVRTLTQLCLGRWQQYLTNVTMLLLLPVHHCSIFNIRQIY